MTRPTEEQKQAFAKRLDENEPSAVAEVIGEELGLTEGTPVLDEVKAEYDEGGGPVADAVERFETAEAEDGEGSDLG